MLTVPLATLSWFLWQPVGNSACDDRVLNMLANGGVVAESGERAVFALDGFKLSIAGRRRQLRDLLG